MLLESILCEFGRICAAGNALMQLKTILCEFGQICATGNALMLLPTITTIFLLCFENELWHAKSTILFFKG